MASQFIQERAEKEIAKAMQPLSAVAGEAGEALKDLVDRIISTAQEMEDDFELSCELAIAVTLTSCRLLITALEDFCEREGVELSKTFKSFIGEEAYETYHTELMKKAFGL